MGKWFLGARSCAANSLPGDLNCDGTINARDINPFVVALSNSTDYTTLFPNCPQANADINGDGSVSFKDINPYVDLLLGRR